MSLTPPWIGGQALAARPTTNVAGPPVYATLDPANSSVNGALSLGNLKYSKLAGEAWANSKATVSKNAGKFYYEVTNNDGTATGNPFLGWSSAALPLDGTYVGSQNNGWGYQQAGNIFVNTVQSTPFDTWSTPGQSARVAVDIANNLVWVGRIGSGLWNGSAANNPATGVGGYAVNFGGGTFYFPTLSVFSFAGTEALTVNFGATAFLSLPPAGFVGVTA